MLSAQIFCLVCALIMQKNKYIKSALTKSVQWCLKILIHLSETTWRSMEKALTNICVLFIYFFQVWTLLWDSTALAEYNHDHHNVNHAEPVHQRPHGHWTQHQTPLVHRWESLWLFTASEWVLFSALYCTFFYSQMNESFTFFWFLSLNVFFFPLNSLIPVFSSQSV